jgi:MarR family transcriptional regulator, organic hydroperoxide resistance regulator
MEIKERKKILENIFEDIYTIRQKLASEMNLPLHKIHITYSQWLVLNLVRKNNRISIKDIAALLDITSSAATQTVDGLVNRGLVSRKRSRTDRRVLEITLSKKSVEHLKRCFSKASLVFDVLNNDELMQYCRLTGKIAGRETIY